MLLASTVVALTGLRTTKVDAMAGCILHSNTSEEQQFLGLLQGWRNQNIAGSYPLTVSAPLNAAAAGYAQYLATHPGAAGHNADGTPGYAWATRAVNCGYPSNAAAGGEGLATVEGSGQLSVSPTQALGVMTAERGGGVWIPSDVGAPVKCVGVAKAVSSDGTKTAWVTLIFATWDVCPQAAVGSNPTSTTTASTTTSTASNTPTKTSTPTPTNTPTPSPTPSPTPNANYGGTLSIAPGWNLVTLPSGPLDDILDTARGCFNAIYQQQGDHWLRYSPLVPAWANNLTSSNGTGFWIDGTGAQGCANIQI